MKPRNLKNILVMAISGIGTNIYLVPTLRLLKEEIQDSHITLLVQFNGAKELLYDSPYIDEIIVVNFNVQKKFNQRIKLIKEMRKRQFDLSITAFPSNKIEKNIFSFLIGAKDRLTHKYPTRNFRNFNFLQNRRISMSFHAHDLEQNLDLLKDIGINTNGADTKLEVWLTNNDRQFADSFLAQHVQHKKSKETIIIGLHPGSSLEFGMHYKRWGVDKFAKLADRLIDKYKCQILIFGGPEEAHLKAAIVSRMNSQAIIIQDTTIKQTAALIEKCYMFISNDSGLMHLATAMDVATIGIFGPTDPIRTAPYGDKHIVVRKDLPCSPCWSLRNIGSPFRCIQSDVFCMKNITVDNVLVTVEGLIGKLNIFRSSEKVTSRKFIEQ